MPVTLCRVAVACLATMMVFGPVRLSAGQSADEFPWLATLTAEEVVRPGSDSRYYPFARLKAGDVVKVVGQKDGWARIVTAGPAFHRTIGFIRHPRTGRSGLRLTADGRAGVTLAPLDVFAPNLDSKEVLDGSWKPVMKLAANRTVTIVEMTSTAQEVVYSIAMPADAEGFIDPSCLRRATESETAMFEASLGDRPLPEPGETAATTPAPAPQIGPLPPPMADVVPVEQEVAGRARLNESVTIEPASPGVAPPPSESPAATGQAEETAETTAAPRPAPVRRSLTPEQRRARIMLEDLEVAYARLLREPIETAEVGPLRLLYLDLAGRHDHGRAVARYARTRARQLELWADVQQQRMEMTLSLQQARRTTEQAAEARRVIESQERYAVVGRLDVSTIYDGKRLPRLLRVQDPDSGRTLAYVEPDERFDYTSLLGCRVGIVGRQAEDEGLRVTLVEPRRIDVLDAGGFGPPVSRPVPAGATGDTG